MPGTFTEAARVVETFRSYSNAAVVANQYLSESPILYPCRLGAVKVRAETAGVGAGNTVVDLLHNGTSVWTTAANRPTLASASTGEMANTAPNAITLKVGDRLVWQVVSIPATTGHARVHAAVTLERP